MKICFVCTNLGFGGAERVMSILSNSFVKNGHDVTFLLNAQKVQVSYQLDSSVKIRNHYCASRFYSIKENVTVVRNLREEFNLIRPDVIIIFDGTHFIHVKFAIQGLGIPVIFSQRNDPNRDSLKLKFHNGISVRFADGLVFQSKGAEKYYGDKVRNVSHIIMNPFYFLNIPVWRYNSEIKKIINVARLSEQKNQLLLINAFLIFFKSHPDYSLEIYGEGPLRNALEEHIRKCGLEGKVQLMGIKDNVFNLLTKSSMFVLSSDYEGIPNALIEAMSVGMPCVSTDCTPGGARELINCGENGLIVPANNPILLADAMSQIADDSNLAITLAENALRIKEKVDVEKVTNLWLNVINETIRRKHHS